MSAKRTEKAGPPAAGPGVPETIEIGAGAFKDRCLALMDDVQAHGRHYLITKRGRPVAKLVPPHSVSPSAHGFLRGTVIEQGDIVAPDPEAWGDLA